VPETMEHLQLVKYIIAHIHHKYNYLPGLTLLIDTPSAEAKDKPPRIARFSPDVYAIDVPVTTTIIGEAKTAYDLTTVHSREQISAFIEHLHYSPCGILVLAVPWQFVACAKIVVESAKRSLSVDPGNVEVTVLDGTEVRGRSDS